MKKVLIRAWHGCGSNAEENVQLLDDYEVSTAKESDDQPSSEEDEDTLANKERNFEDEVTAILENPYDFCEAELYSRHIQTLFEVS